MVQLSYPYMTAKKPIALTRQTFVGNVMSLLFNVLSRLAIAFLPRGKHVLISWPSPPEFQVLLRVAKALLVLPAAGCRVHTACLKRL